MIDKQLLIDAKNGMAEAQSYLGYKYIEGKDTPQDYRKAYNWLLKAADQGYAIAQHNLGHMYTTVNEGVSIDYEKAIYWYTKAAKQGYAFSQHNLGRLYLLGEHVEQDFEEAFIWLSIASKQGHTGAQCTLGQMYLDGRGLPESPKVAAYWIGLARSKGNEIAKELWSDYELWEYVDD